MAGGKDFQEKLKILREQALERMSQAQSEIIKDADKETRRLLHELNVHQIELELQNEELREAQRRLERSRDRYLRLYHHAPVGYITANAAGIVLQANKTFGLMLDRDIAKLLHKPLSDLIHPEDRDIFFARFRTFFKNPAGKLLEVRMQKSNGAVCHTKLEGRRIDPSTVPDAQRDLAGSLLISISDITRRKIAEQAIINAKKQWEQTFDAVPDLIAIIDENFDIVRVNMALAKRLGVEPRDCTGKKCYEILHGRNIPSEDCPHPRFNDNRLPARAEVFNPKLNGYFITTVSPFNPDTRGDQSWSILVFHDISDRKQAENELLKSRNLESIGTLAGGIAHDFNNILTAVVGHIDLARMHGGENKKLAEHLDSSLRACHRARDLANRLITFSKGGAPRRHVVRIDRIIEEVTTLSLSGANVDCRLDLADELQPLIIDEAQVKAALQNIINNAREAMPWGGNITIRACKAQVAGQNGNPTPKGQYIRIDISDQGAGIAPSHLDKIFDPYFTTKQMGARKGMGLGLAIAHSIIKKHKGHIEVQSKQEQGTTVTIFLPLSANARPEDRVVPAHEENSSAPACRVLFMDDERMLWKVVKQMLKRMACEVDCTANADEALFLFRQSLRDGEPYTAVILDLTIRGGMGGKEVVREMRSIDPGVKALAVSGYSSDPVFADFRQYGFVGALKKPFQLGELTTALSRIVNAVGPAGS